MTVGGRTEANPRRNERWPDGAAARTHEIRAWADIRNNCGHGDGDKVKPEDVGRMIQGVRAFMADHLK